MTDGPDLAANTDGHSSASRPRELEIVKAPTGQGHTGGISGTEETLSVPHGYRPRKRDDVLELDMVDGAILYDNESMLVHHLNPSAALIWHLCDGIGSVDELARDIAVEYKLDPKSITDQVSTVIAELDALGLVEDQGR